jgi:hypothetical protein
MKTNESGNQDETLRKLLKEWHTDAPLPLRFQEQVWRRIEQVQSPVPPSLWLVIVHWIGAVLPRPALAMSYLVVLLAVGATFGWAHARQETARVKEQLGERYVRVLDPYQAPHD